ncbi:MAG TPA: dihydrofolate reductase family protein, partial [Candidatus Polarisedimenticolia bacterium]|nr:dihydrofolate reductase family protein [Candidatus Polarisedimenticolia bacterium]
GSEVLGSALDAGVGDRLVLYVAGRILGGRAARPVFGGHGVARLGAAARLEQMTVRPIGPDFVVEGRLRFPSRRSDGA